MTIDEFFKDIENYYGGYDNEYLKGSVKSYLQKDYKEDKYLEISRAIKYFHRHKSGSPCIASIEYCIKQARIEKSQTDPHKTKTTDTTVYDYSKDPECEKGTKKVDLTGMLNKTIKKVER